MRLRILLSFGLILFLTACPARKNNSPPAPQTPAPQDSGGGVDSSGGDPILSSTEQVEEAVAKIEAKSFNALNRATLVFATTDRYSFDRDYGIGSHDVLEQVLTGNKFKLPNAVTQLDAKKIIFKINRDGSCLAGKDKAHKAGSALGRAGAGEVCLSVPELRKVSPAAIEVEAVALAIHEIGHLYFGEDEPKAIRLQKFFVQNTKFSALDPRFTNQIKDMFENIDRALAQVLNAEMERNITTMCLGLGELSANIHAFMSIYNVNKGSIPNSAKFYSEILRAIAATELSRGFCGNSPPSQFLTEYGSTRSNAPVGKADWASLLNNFEGMTHPFFTARYLFTMLEDPYLDQPHSGPSDLLLGSSELLFHEDRVDRRKQFEKEIAAFDPGQNIFCRDGEIKFENGKLRLEMANQLLSPTKIFENANGKLYNIRLLGQDAMVRMRAKMMAGVSITPMIAKLQVATTIGGLVARDGQNLMLLGALGPGVNDKVQFSIQDPETGAYRTAYCRYSATPLRLQDLEVETPPMTIHMASKLNDLELPYHDDPSYYREAKGTLKIYAGERRGESYVRGGLVKELPIKAVGVSSDKVVIDSTEEKTSCLVPEGVINKKGLSPQSLAQRIFSGTTIVHCYKDGQANQPLKTFSVWANDFEITNAP